MSGATDSLFDALPPQVRTALGAAEYALMRGDENDRSDALAMINDLRDTTIWPEPWEESHDA